MYAKNVRKAIPNNELVVMDYQTMQILKYLICK